MATTTTTIISSLNPKPHFSLSTSSSSSKPQSSTLLCRCSFLHDSLHAAGFDTHHARVAREAFCSEVGRLTYVTRETSIADPKGIDLARAALHVAAEDDSLVSHSSVPLPVDDFVRRLGDLSMGFCSIYADELGIGGPEGFLANLDEYLYVHKGFRRRANQDQPDARALYLHSVLTCRYGSSAMLSIIYSEILNMLRLWGFLDFEAEICYPRDNFSLPRGYDKKNSNISGHAYLLTTQSFLVEILKNLKDVFWPFKYDHRSSLFLRAADAASLGGHGFVVNTSSTYDNVSFEIASAKAAQHRLERGVWTNVRFGDMRRALAACERLILLDTDPLELRDYAVLLYHCGYYEESLLYLNLYQSSREKTPSTQVEELEEEAVQKLLVRLNFISMEDGWNRPTVGRNFWCKNSEPW